MLISVNCDSIRPLPNGLSWFSDDQLGNRLRGTHHLDSDQPYEIGTFDPVKKALLGEDWRYDLAHADIELLPFAALEFLCRQRCFLSGLERHNLCAWGSLGRKDGQLHVPFAAWVKGHWWWTSRPVDGYWNLGSLAVFKVRRWR